MLPNTSTIMMRRNSAMERNKNSLHNQLIPQINDTIILTGTPIVSTSINNKTPPILPTVANRRQRYDWFSSD